MEEEAITQDMHLKNLEKEQRLILFCTLGRDRAPKVTITQCG